MNVDIVCAYCAKPGELSRDHVVPRSRGGPDHAGNIVMACRLCNSAKGDRLASEWLGERCPQRVLLIEAQVNAKLKAVYKRRSKPEEPSRLYAFTIGDGGHVQYIGEVVSEGERFVRLSVVNAFNLWCGIWDMSGELVDAPRERVRLFTDRDSMLDAVDRQK